ncbi:MAG: hypothetical protein CMO01_11960 [Thalassobius sp.]|nr:hypothetical protein [Thalassovita sp.]
MRARHLFAGIHFFLFLSFLNCNTSFSQIVVVEDNQVERDSAGWQVIGNVDFYNTRNTSTVFSINAGTQIQYKWHRSKIISMNAFSAILNTSSENPDQENRGYQHIRYNYDINQTVVYEAFTQLQFDQVLRIQRRLLLGTGLRFNLLKDESEDDLSVGLTYMYEYEREKDTTAIHRDHRMSSYISAKKQFNESIALSLISYYQPLFNEFSDYRISLGAGLNFKILNKLAFVIDVNLNYDAKPVVDEDIPDLTYSIRNGLSFKF